MRIWIDLTNSPHVNFFEGMIAELRLDHDVVLTSRPLANTIDLLELKCFPYHAVGKHYGQSSVKKALGFGVRVLQLYRFFKDQPPDVAISHSSFYSPVVASLLRIPSIYLNDNEHAGGNRISFLFADHIMVPEFLDIRKVQRQWAKPEKIIRYPGVKEGVYLWHYSPLEGAFAIDDRRDRRVIFVRPEPWTAQYYKGERNFMDTLLLDLKEKFKIILLPRGKVQEDYYREKRFIGITVPGKSINLSEIMPVCDLFLGAGGTMTREAAVLGIPTISIYQDELLDVDRFLIAKGAMVHSKCPDAAFVTRFLENIGKRAADPELLQKGKQAYSLVMETILSSATGRGGRKASCSKEA